MTEAELIIVEELPALVKVAVPVGTVVGDQLAAAFQSVVTPFQVASCASAGALAIGGPNVTAAARNARHRTSFITPHTPMRFGHQCSDRRTPQAVRIPGCIFAEIRALRQFHNRGRAKMVPGVAFG